MKMRDYFRKWPYRQICVARPNGKLYLVPTERATHQQLQEVWRNFRHSTIHYKVRRQAPKHYMSTDFVEIEKRIACAYGMPEGYL